MVTNSTLQRPILWGSINLRSSTISDLHLANPPNWFNFMSGNRDVLVSDMNLTVTSNGTAAKNTGEWTT